MNIVRFSFFVMFALGVGFGVGQESALAVSPEKAPKAAPKEEADEQEDNAKSNAPLPLGQYLAGRFAEAQGDTQNGLKFVEDSLKKDPDNKKTLSSLYRMYILSGNFEKIEPVATKLVGTKVVDDGSEFSPEMFLALSSTKKGDYVKASQFLSKVPKSGFNNLLAPLMQQWLKLGRGEIKAPIDIKTVVTDPRLILPHVYLHLAMINDLAGFKDQARNYYELAVKDENTQPFRAVEALANFYARGGETDKRKKLVDGYIAAHGESFLATELLVNSKGADSKPLVNDAPQGVAELFYTISNIFHGVRPPADEIAALHLALYLRPDFPPAQFLLAGAHELAQDYPTAIATYKTIDEKSAYFVRGRIRSLYDESESGNEHVEDSLARLTTLAEQMPHDIDALLAKGDILRVHDRYADAVVAYSAAVDRLSALDKHHWILFFSRGACLERLNKWTEAEADMKKALSLSPGEPDVLNYLGYSWLSKRHNIAEAKKMIEDAYEARPEDAHIIDSMGYALYVSGDYQSAQEYFQQALERTPDDPTVNDHLGDTYWQMGRKTEAKFQWNRALAAEKDVATKQQITEKLEKGIPLKPSKQAADDKKNSIELPADE